MVSAALRSEVSTDLHQMANVLNSKGFCLDVSPLYRAAGHFQQDNLFGATKIGYRLEKLSFNLDPQKGVSPTGVKDFLIELSVFVTMGSSCPADDPFIDLNIDIEKSGKRKSTELKAAWHFDRHAYSSAAGDNHPLYHFQLGGYKLDHLKDKLGNTFITQAPRIMHPPMDAVIAIDFVFANYAVTKWRKLREDSIYQELIKRAYKRLWAPYFQRIGNHFLATTAVSNDNALSLCPFLF